jgi:Xaa-Pro aminopeptidase
VSGGSALAAEAATAPGAAAADRARAGRLEHLREELLAREVDALLVNELHDVRYVTGFTGSTAVAVLATASGGASTASDRFYTDFRYETQSSEQVAASFSREIVSGNLLEAVARGLTGSGRLGFDGDHLTYAEHARLREHLPPSWELVPCAGAVRAVRLVKDAGEVACMRAASQLADEALRGVLEAGVVGRTEHEVAVSLEMRMRELGAEAASFPSIVAAGAHGALPHAKPRACEIERDVLLTVDWGALLDGYCSDCTRTFATGEGVSAQAREVYELVLAAQEAALASVRPGPNGRELDAVARAVIESGGHGEHFGHGLGHGVGMQVHEGPRLAKNGSEEPLREGNAVTIEPGIYLPGQLGVRIEDLVIVGADRADVLTHIDKTLMVVG